MLEETSCDRADSDVLAHSGDACPEAADASYYEVDLNSGIGCRVKRFDNRLINQGIDLRDNAGGLACLGILSLSSDPGYEVVLFLREGQ